MFYIGVQIVTSYKLMCVKFKRSSLTKADQTVPKCRLMRLCQCAGRSVFGVSFKNY